MKMNNPLRLFPILHQTPLVLLLLQVRKSSNYPADNTQSLLSVYNYEHSKKNHGEEIQIFSKAR